jgi:hypothetical protein
MVAMSRTPHPHQRPSPSADAEDGALLGRSPHRRTVALVLSFVLGLLFAVMSQVDGVDQAVEPEHESSPAGPVAALATQPDLAVGNALEVHVVAPSDWLGQVQPGSRFRFHAEDDGRVLDGRVTRLAPVTDPQARTIRVIGALLTYEPGSVLPGMHGRADFGAVGAVPASIGRSQPTVRPPRAG